MRKERKGRMQREKGGYKALARVCSIRVILGGGKGVPNPSTRAMTDHLCERRKK